MQIWRGSLPARLAPLAVTAVAAVMAVGGETFPSEATARDGAEPPVFGVYADPAAERWAGATATCSITMYLLLLEAEAPAGITGWECSLVMRAGAGSDLFVVTPAHEGVNHLALPNLRVALPAVVPAAPVVLLAEVAVSNVCGGEFGIGPCEPSLFPGDPGPGYWTGDAPALPVRGAVVTTTPWPDRPGTFLAGQFADALPAADSTWGAVKVLYGR